MHGWEGQPFDEVAELTMKRDPRLYPVCCVTGNDAQQYIQWFRNVTETSHYLSRMEPQRWGYRQAQLIQHKTELQSVLTQVDVKGFQEDLRQAFNQVTEPIYRIVWWGAFDSFRHAPEGPPASLRAELGDPQDIESLVAALRERANASQ
jgi:hypothetical protein